jgi:hypothetical protein
MKKYFKYIVLFLTVLNYVNIHSQDQLTNLEKYWEYRVKLIDDFTIQDSDVLRLGVNIPLASIWVEPPVELGDGQWYSNVIKSGDGNNVRGNYLSVLATELWLLKNNEQDYSETLKELYYFMLAMERLDAYSESFIRAAEDNNMYDNWDQSLWNPISHYNEGDINGFMIRNDFDHKFWDDEKTNFPANVLHLASTMYNVPPDDERKLNQSSQDNILHMLQGLSLLKSLVGTEDVSQIPVYFRYQHIPNYLSNKNIINGNNVNFGLWAEDFTKRFLDNMQNDNYKWSTVGAALTLLAPYLGTYYLTKWYLWDPVRDEKIFEGNGLDASLHGILCHGFLDIGENITGIDLQEDGNFTGSRVVYDGQFSDPSLNKIINKLVRYAGALGDSHGINTLSILRGHMTSQYEEGRDGNDHLVPFEHLPLIYIVLFRDRYDRDDFYTIGSTEYNDEIDYYNDLLDAADHCGECSYLAPEWSWASRINDPENLTYFQDKDARYTGLDYMLIHNLRYIAYLWPEFDDVTAPTWYYDETNTLSGGDIYSQSVIVDSDIEFKATRKIVLQPGFKVVNSHFLAHIVHDQNAYEPTGYVKLNVTECNLPEIVHKKAAAVDFKEDITTNVFEEEFSTGVFSVYPNPVETMLNINIPELDTNNDVSVTIYNSYGQMIFNKKFESSTKISVDFSNLPRGMHLLNVECGVDVYYEKIFKL